MCGFAGFIKSIGPVDRSECKYLLSKMGDAIAHRGPDGEGYWLNDSAGIGLVHRRLSVIDLSLNGAQPMISNDGRYIIAFNGEIYNHKKIRAELQREGKITSSWRGHSDTETLLTGFEVWGIESTLKRSVGMFSIALWDNKLRILTLARDRFGEKPLYYGWQGYGSEATFLFGSELAALKQHPAFSASINRDALSDYLKYNYIGGSNSIYNGINKLLPGHILKISPGSTDPVVNSWWSVTDCVMHGKEQQFNGTPLEAVDSLENLLRDAVGQQMSADVPLGGFLSGGVDSSTVIALMQEQSVRPIRTFSIGFHEERYNEAVHAKAVAKHLGTDHCELYVSSEDALRIIPKLPGLYSEPFADSSQIPTFLVSQLARQHVTVSLSGDAGDELFCGYNRYQLTASLWSRIKYFPKPLRQRVATLITKLPLSSWDNFGKLLRMNRMGHKVSKAAGLLDSTSVADLYNRMISYWYDSGSVVLDTSVSPLLLTNAQSDSKNISDIEFMMLFDMMSYLPDDVLVKVDRAAMGVGLETRVPFLDHRVVEFAWSLPLSYKLRLGVTKWPLRQVLYRHVPRELIERPKMGFGVPIEHWLRGPLRDWAETLLSESRLRNEGYFNPYLIRKKWNEHLSGHRNWEHHLWSVLMFQAWLKN